MASAGLGGQFGRCIMCKGISVLALDWHPPSTDTQVLYCTNRGTWRYMVCRYPHRCHGPFSVVDVGKRELTFGPHSTQDMQALIDAELL